jgi:hypothetical protein
LEDHRGRGLCVDLQKPLYFFFIGAQLAWPCYRDPLRVGGSMRNFLTVFGSI